MSARSLPDRRGLRVSKGVGGGKGLAESWRRPLAAPCVVLTNAAGGGVEEERWDVSLSIVLRLPRCNGERVR